MEFASAAWLAATAAVILPVILHLRNRRPPDVLRVGSIADIVPGSSVRHRRRLDDVPLLIIRCFVVVLVAIVLAGPMVRGGGRRGTRVAVVPIGGERIGDSLKRAGVAFAPVTLSPHPWSMAVWADTAVGPADTIVMVVPSAAALPRTTRPTLRHALQVIAPAESLVGVAPSQVRPQVVAGTTGTPGRRDLRGGAWYALIAVAAIERLMAARRRAG